MTPTFTPAYQALSASQYQDRISQMNAMMTCCISCGWMCKVDRTQVGKGVCKTTTRARVSSYGAHMGEETPLSGRRGSGTIFFSRCNLRCQYCQNHDISQTDTGVEITAQELAVIMLELQAIGCHNINFVSPTHVASTILEGVYLAAQKGLSIPLVYNTGGYDSIELLSLFDGIIDIYMPDMKYGNPQTARKYSKCPNYPNVNQAAVREMYRQVGNLHVTDEGIATRGLLVRHLVLPNNLAGTKTVVSFIANQISKETYINIMDQYRPVFRAKEYPQINRPITNQEFKTAVETALNNGLYRLDQRHILSMDF
jgi:putative pyruvate formate lyase activating enzyme